MRVRAAYGVLGSDVSLQLSCFVLHMCVLHNTVAPSTRPRHYCRADLNEPELVCCVSLVPLLHSPPAS